MTILFIAVLIPFISRAGEGKLWPQPAAHP
jgi:hypothetical protein